MNLSNSFKKLDKKRQESITGLLMIAPAVILLIIFVFVPLGMAIYRSLFETVNGATEFVGIKFYLRTLENEQFLRSIINVLVFAVIITALQIVLSFLFANVLVRIKGRFGVFARTIIYLPYLLSGVVVSVIFTLLTYYNGGVLNSIIESFGGDPIAWKNDDFWAPVSIIIPTLWIGFGYTTLVMYAGLTNIPKDYYEAADIDGAGFWKKMFSISIPCMKNYFILLVVTNIVGNLQMYEIPMIMTDGTENVITPVFYIMLNRSKGDISDSQITALAILVMVIILIINSFVFYFFRDKEAKR